MNRELRASARMIREAVGFCLSGRFLLDVTDRKLAENEIVAAANRGASPRVEFDWPACLAQGCRIDAILDRVSSPKVRRASSSRELPLDLFDHEPSHTLERMASLRIMRLEFGLAHLPPVEIAFHPFREQLKH